MDRILWTVLVLAIGVALYVGSRPAMISQAQASVQAITNTLPDVDSSSHSKFNYSAPDETNDTISITGYTGNATNLVIPKYRKIGLKFYKITKIYDWAFQGQTSLKSVTINDNITEIGAGTFQADSNLADVDLSNSVTTIGDYAFQKDNISTINIPAKSTIGKWAFNQNPITNVNFGGAVSLDAGAFTETKLSTVTLPKGSTYNSDFTDNNQSFEATVLVNGHLIKAY